MKSEDFLERNKEALEACELYQVQCEELEKVKNALKNDQLICECFAVTLHQIQHCVQVNQEISFAILRDKLALSKGCGSCTQQAMQWLHILKEMNS